jgi:hypothetical protein
METNNEFTTLRSGIEPSQQSPLTYLTHLGVLIALPDPAAIL